METLDTITLSRGAHRTREAGMCAMEAAAYLAGEPHSDHPECVCPVVAAFMRAWQDKLDDRGRETLVKPLIPLVIGTRSTPDVQDARAIAVADWSIRHVLPAWLRLTPSLVEHADRLAALPELTTVDALNDARTGPVAGAWAAARAAAVDAARAAAAAAAEDAAWAAAEAAARAAARAAAWAAAWDAARAAAAAAAEDAAWAAAEAAARAAARAAAVDAAWAAAWDAAAAAAEDAAWAAAEAAAEDAAWDAAGDALAPTVAQLQADSVDLIRRLVAIEVAR
jgi:hypothetical protein